MRRAPPLIAASVAATTSALALSAWHIARNVAPPSWDDAWYLETSFRLWTALQESPLSFLRAYQNAFHIKAPLISLIPIPLYSACGMNERIAVWANIPLAALAAWAWSRAAALWWRPHPRAEEAGAIGGALAALLPIVYGLSRYFFVETLIFALLGLWAWRCAAARSDDEVEGWRLGAILGLGLLAKVSFPLFALGFAWPARRRLLPHLKKIAFAAGLISATWYASNLPYVLGFAWSAGFGSVAKDYAGAGRLQWLGSIASNGFSWPLTLASISVAAAALAFSQERPREGIRTALWALSPLAIFALSSNHEIRLAAPLFPVLALLAGRAAVSFPKPAARIMAVALLLCSGLFVCVRQTFGFGPALAFNGPPSQETGWNRVALVDAIVSAGGSDAVAAVALEHRFLNANNLSSAAAARGLTLSFVSLGYAQNSVEAALIRLKDKNVSFIILVSGLSGSDLPEFLNRANSGVAAALRSGRIHARMIATVSLAPGISAEVWRRIW